MERSAAKLEIFVKNLAESESAQLDLSLGELPICIDADAGGGRKSIQGSRGAVGKPTALEEYPTGQLFFEK